MSLQFEKLNVPSAYQVVSRELRRMILRRGLLQALECSERGEPDSFRHTRLRFGHEDFDCSRVCSCHQAV